MPPVFFFTQSLIAFMPLSSLSAAEKACAPSVRFSARR